MAEKNDCGCGKPVDPEQTDVVKMSCCPPVPGKAARGFNMIRIVAYLFVVAGLAVLIYALVR